MAVFVNVTGVQATTDTTSPLVWGEVSTGSQQAWSVNTPSVGISWSTVSPSGPQGWQEVGGSRSYAGVKIYLGGVFEED